MYTAHVLQCSFQEGKEALINLFQMLTVDINLDTFHNWKNLKMMVNVHAVNTSDSFFCYLGFNLNVYSPIQSVIRSIFLCIFRVLNKI